MRKAIRNPGASLRMCEPEVFYPTAGMVHEKRELLPEVTQASRAHNIVPLLWERPACDRAPACWCPEWRGVHGLLGKAA